MFVPASSYNSKTLTTQIQLFYNRGVSDLIMKHPQLVQGAVYSNPEVPVCRKNTGKTGPLGSGPEDTSLLSEVEGT